MPPQQGQNLLDFGNGLFDFRAHWCSFSYCAPCSEPGRRDQPLLENDVARWYFGWWLVS
jgi:hypothetical protein